MSVVIVKGTSLVGLKLKQHNRIVLVNVNKIWA